MGSRRRELHLACVARGRQYSFVIPLVFAGWSAVGKRRSNTSLDSLCVGAFAVPRGVSAAVLDGEGQRGTKTTARGSKQWRGRKQRNGAGPHRAAPA